MLFNCDDLTALRDPKKLTKIVSQVTFKLIDFGDAFFMDGSDLTKKIIKIRTKISEFCDKNELKNAELNDPFTSYLMQTNTS